MRCKVGLFLIGLIIVFLLINAATDPKRGARQERDTDTEPKQQRQHSEDPLKCPQSPVKAEVGEDVTLDFHFEPKRDVTLITVEWKFNKSVLVLLYRSRDFYEKDQHEQFKGRARLDSSGNLTEGKLPLKIPKVTTADFGLYSCSVRFRKDKIISCSTELIIGSDSRKRVVNKAQNQSGPQFVLVLTASTFLYSLCH